MRYGVEKFKNYFSIFSLTVKDRVLIFSGMTDLSIGVWNYWLTMLAVTSSCHWKWKKKSKCSKIIFQIKTYTTFLSWFPSVQNNWPHRKLNRHFTSGYFKYKLEIINFQCFESSLLLKGFTWILYMLLTLEMSKKKKKRKCPFRWWDMVLRNSKIAFPFFQKRWKIESWYFQGWQISHLGL